MYFALTSKTYLAKCLSYKLIPILLELLNLLDNLENSSWAKNLFKFLKEIPVFADIHSIESGVELISK